MRRFHAVLVVLASACGGSTGGPEDPAKVIVPAQPPQPVATASAPPPAASSASVAVAAPEFSCTTGKRFEAGARSYCAYAEPATWENAEARCVANGGHLMSFDSPSTSDAVHLTLGSPQRAARAAWIGLESPQKTKTSWKWITGEAVTAASWNNGEPNNWDGNEGCGEWLVANGKWNDTRCNLNQHFLCQSVPPATMTCPGRSFGPYCYMTMNLPFGQAKNVCKQQGGRLATPRTDAESEALKSGMAQRFEATRMWIGLNDLASPGTWVWSNGSPLRYRAWTPGEPNAYGREGCVELFADRWTWNDLDCAEKLPSVCESPAKKP